MAVKRFFRFSLLTLLGAFTTAAALCAAWVGYRERFQRQQRICEQLVRDLGGEHANWSDPHDPNDHICGFGMRSEGLEFGIERNSSWAAHLYSRGLFEVTAAYITYDYQRKMSQRAALDLKIREISKLSSLRSLSIDSEKLTDDDLSMLRRLPNLSKLSIECEIISEQTFRHIGEMRNLTELRLGAPRQPFEPRPNKTGAGLTYLANLRRLESLFLDDLTLEDGGLGAFPSLRNLYLFQCTLSRKALQSLANCKNLETLSICNSEFDAKASADMFSGMSSLKELRLDNATIDGCLGAIPSLHQLRLWRCTLSASALQSLGKCKSLEDLEIIQSQSSANVREPMLDGRFPAMGLSTAAINDDALGKLPLLRRLSIDTRMLSAAALRSLADCRSIEILSFTLGVNQQNEVMQVLKRLKGLETLEMIIDNDGHDLPFETSSSLRDLELSLIDSARTIEGFGDLACCKNLKSLTIRSSNGCESKEVKLFGEDLAGLCNLVGLKQLTFDGIMLNRSQRSWLKDELVGVKIAAHHMPSDDGSSGYWTSDRD